MIDVASSYTSMPALLARIETELEFAGKLLQFFPDEACAAEREEAQAFLARSRSGMSADNAGAIVAECERMLTKTATLAKSITVHMVAHAHIDMNWMWGYDETVAVTLDTFGTMLKLMERYPEFTFSQSQASVYRIVEKYNPAMLKEIRQRVAEGRWEVSSCTWVEGDKNMASGESQVRQVLYAKRFFRDIFGLSYDDIRLDFEPDTFGHNLNIPAILAQAGVRYYYHCRATDGPKLSRWQSPDGSSLLCYFEKGDDWYNYDVSAARVVDSAYNEIKETGCREVLRVYGVGDHGGGPTVRDIESIIEMAAWPVFPTARFSTYGEYFNRIEAADPDLPRLEGERNFIFTGCYTSQSDTKAANRYGEKLLFTAEALAALAGKLDKDFSYPQANLQDAWEKVLFSQFHDILPGSGKRQTRHYALGQHQEVKAAAGVALKSALAAINGAIDTGAVIKAAGIQAVVGEDRAFGAGAGFWQVAKGVSLPAVDDRNCRLFTVFNPSSFPRSEVVEAVLWDMEDSEGALVVKDDRGREVAYQMLEEPRYYWGHTFQRILFEAGDVPALGYKTFIVYRDAARQAKELEEWNYRLEASTEATLENEILRVELDTASGAVKSLVMKDIGTEFVPRQEATALFRIIDEGPSISAANGKTNPGMTAWQIGAYAGIEPVKGVRYIDEGQPDFTLGVEKTSFKAVRGALRTGFVWTARLRNSELTTAVYLDKGSDRINIDCQCNWLETGRPGGYVPQLNIVFPLALEGTVRHFEVPFGAIRRDARNMDLPALRWADISGIVKGTGSQAGLTVMTDSKYGYRAGDDSLAVSLIRSSYDPDPFPELGEHRFSLALRPHYGPCDKAAAFRQAIAFEQPLIVSQATAGGGTMPSEGSFLEVMNDNLVLSALKRQEDGDGIVVRLYEIAGRDTQAKIRFSPQLAGPGAMVAETDLLERKTGKAREVANNAVIFHVPAYGILTLLLENAPMGN